MGFRLFFIAVVFVCSLLRADDEGLRLPERLDDYKARDFAEDLWRIANNLQVPIEWTDLQADPAIYDRKFFQFEAMRYIYRTLPPEKRKEVASEAVALLTRSPGALPLVPKYKESAVSVLGVLGGDLTPHFPAVRQLLKNRKFKIVKEEILRHLLKEGDEESIPLAKEISLDADGYALPTFIALSQMKSPKAREAVRQIAVESTDDSITAAALESLGSDKSPDSLKIVVDVATRGWKKEKNPEKAKEREQAPNNPDRVVGAALTALGKNGSEEALAALSGYLKANPSIISLYRMDGVVDSLEALRPLDEAKVLALLLDLGKREDLVNPHRVLRALSRYPSDAWVGKASGLIKVASLSYDEALKRNQAAKLSSTLAPLGAFHPLEAVSTLASASDSLSFPEERLIELRALLAAQDPTAKAKLSALATEVEGREVPIEVLLELAELAKSSALPSQSYDREVKKRFDWALASPALRERRLNVLETAKLDLSESAKRRYDRLFHEVYLAKEGALESRDACEVACELARNSKKWLKDDYVQKSDFATAGFPGHSWEFAMTSLHALFLEKAAPFCESRPGELSSVFSIAHFQKLEALAERGRKFVSMGMSVDAPSAYAKQFYATYLTDLKNATLRKEAPPEDVARAKAFGAMVDSAIEKNRAALFKEIMNYEKTAEGFEGSLSNTFLVTTAACEIDREVDDFIGILEANLAVFDKPTQAPYTLKNKPVKSLMFATERGASARAVTSQYARYLKNRSRDGIERRKSDLIAALANFGKQSPSLAANVEREGMHIGRPKEEDGESDGLAPYFFYPAAPFAFSAMAALEADPTVTAKEKADLAETRRSVQKRLLKLIRSDGLIAPLGLKTYPSSPAYANPLAGLALLASSPECNGRKVGVLLGRSLKPAPLEKAPPPRSVTHR